MLLGAELKFFNAVLLVGFSLEVRYLLRCVDSVNSGVPGFGFWLGLLILVAC